MWISFVKLLTWAIKQAAGEAEAELALLNVRGQIDAVETQDVDALVFGAQLVIRP